MNDLLNVMRQSLSGEQLETAMSFAEFLAAQGMTFEKDRSVFRRDKTYYLITWRDARVCEISVADPDDTHLWTVWSVNSPSYETAEVSDEVRETAWRSVDLCHYCGSCGGGRPRTVFGKRFDAVCGGTFRVDDAGTAEFAFLREMISLRQQDINRKFEN